MVELQIGAGPVEVLSYEEFEQRVIEGRVPLDAKIRFEPVTGAEFVSAGELDLFKSLQDSAQVAWRLRFRESGPPVVTALLVGLQIRIWLAAQLPGNDRYLTYRYANWLPPALEDGEMWRIITSGLLHTDFLHILLNMVWMAYTGWNIERALGRRNLLSVFFLSVVTGGLLSMFMTPNTPSIGASGGVFGLVSASVVFGFIRQDLLPEKSRRFYGAALAPYLLLMFFSGLSNEGTDNWAHGGGLACGVVLAFLLDPPGFERRRRQNTLVQSVGFGATLVVFVVLSMFGPRVHPLIGKDQARLASLSRSARQRAIIPKGLLLSDLEWQVPAGWAPGTNAAGDPVFESPALTKHRSFTVLQREDDHRLSLDELEVGWTEALKRGFPDVETVSSRREWLGRPAVEVTASLDDGGRLRMVGTVRGVYQLYEVQEVMEDDAVRLKPLFDRLDAHVEWFEPLSLQAARRDQHASPNSVETRGRLADELAKWGEVEEATAIYKDLAAERPKDPSRWIQYIAMAANYPSQVNLIQVVDQALAVAPTPGVIVEASTAMRSQDPSIANGLLYLGWLHRPGDRKLKNALRRAGLRWTLSENGVANAIAQTPDGGLRSAEELAELEAIPFTIEGATRLGERIGKERQELERAFRSELNGGDPVGLLLRIRDGGLTPVFEDQALLRRNLIALRNDRKPTWISDELAAVLLEPGVLDELLALID